MLNSITFKESQVYFTDEGKGNPVILLHGYLESLKIWDCFTPLLSGHHRIIRIDLPGHGVSTVSGNIASMEFMAESVLAVMDCLKIEKTFLVGHSMGGYVTLAFLDLFKERLTGFCLFHSQPFADTPEIIKKRKREILLILEGKKDVICNLNIPNAFADDNLEIFENDIGFAKEVARSTSDLGIVASLNGLMTRPDRSQLLSETTLPFLWILGKKDKYIPHDLIIEKVKLPANSTLVSLRNSGHQGFMEEGEFSSKAIMTFLSNLE